MTQLLEDTRNNRMAELAKVVIVVKTGLQMAIRFKHNTLFFQALRKELTLYKVMATRDRGRISYDTHPVPVYSAKTVGEETVVCTGSGFIDRVATLIEKQGMRLKLLDATKRDPKSYLADIPDKSAFTGLDLREEQTAIVNEIDQHDHGQFIAATGSGKTFLIRALCKYYPKARFLITTYSLKLLENIYKDLCGKGLLNVAMYTSKSKQKGARIQLCSVDSLDNFADDTFDILIVDERQEVCTSKRMNSLLNVKARRCYGFSANENDRLDKADKFSEAVAGPVRFRATYEASVDAKSVVPMEVEWRRYNCTPMENLNSASPTFARHAFWRNEDRNQAVVAAIKEHAKRGQVLVYVKTVEHIYALKQLYDCPVVHAEQDGQKWLEWQKRKLIPHGTKQPTAEDVSRLMVDFKEGKVPVVICNSVWKRGVDFPGLETVILAHGGTSAEEIIQAAGRASRVKAGKTAGRVVDFLDDFCFSARNRVLDRAKIYNKQKWTVVSTAKP